MEQNNGFDAYHAEAIQNVRRNFLLNSLDGILFTFGFAFIDPASVVPAFIRRLGGSDFLISLIPAAQAIGWMTPQIFISNFVERLRWKKPYVVALGVWERLPYLSVVPLCFLFGSSHPTLLLWACLGGFFAAPLVSGFDSPAWFDLVAKVTPLRQRGRLSAVKIALGTLLGVGAGWIVERVLDHSHIPFPENYAWLFVMAVFLMGLSLLCISFVREPLYPVENRREKLRDYLSKIPAILKKEKNFRNFIIGTFLQRATVISLAFYSINGLVKFQLPDKWVGTFTVCIMGGRLLVTPVFGFLGDRYGHKINLVVGSLAYLGASVLAIFAPNKWSYLPVFALFSTGYSSDLVSRFNMAVEFCTPERRPTYVALSNTLLGPTGILALLGGLMVPVIGYNGLFVISGLFALSSALWMIAAVREPRKLPRVAVSPSAGAQF